jgi:hypothetical protein
MISDLLQQLNSSDDNKNKTPYKNMKNGQMHPGEWH